MRLALIDETDSSVVEYSQEVFKKLLIKYFEVHKDIEKSFDLLTQDLKDKIK
jgi:hypothetical protein